MVFDAPFLPGRVRVSEKDLCAQLLGDEFVACELAAVVGCDRPDMGFVWQQCRVNCVNQSFCVLAFRQLPGEEEVRAALHNSQDCVLAVGADDSVHLEVSESRAVALGRALVNHDAVLHGGVWMPSILPFLVLEAVPAELPQVAPVGPVGADVGVNSLHTGEIHSVLSHLAAYLLGGIMLSQLFAYNVPDFRSQGPVVLQMALAGIGKGLGLPAVIASLAAVAADFPRDCTLRHTDSIGYHFS